MVNILAECTHHYICQNILRTFLKTCKYMFKNILMSWRSLGLDFQPLQVTGEVQKCQAIRDNSSNLILELLVGPLHYEGNLGRHPSNISVSTCTSRGQGCRKELCTRMPGSLATSTCQLWEQGLCLYLLLHWVPSQLWHLTFICCIAVFDTRRYVELNQTFCLIYSGLSFRRHAISARCCFLTSAVLHHTREFISINLHTRVLNVEQSADLCTSRPMSLRTACIIPGELGFGQYKDSFCCQLMYNLWFLKWFSIFISTVWTIPASWV